MEIGFPITIILLSFFPPPAGSGPSGPELEFPAFGAGNRFTLKDLRSTNRSANSLEGIPVWPEEDSFVTTMIFDFGILDLSYVTPFFNHLL